MQPISLSYTVRLTVTAAQIDEIIQCAIDGGIHYWCPECSFGSVNDSADDSPNTFNYFRGSAETATTVVLRQESVERGLQLTAEKAPQVFAHCFAEEGGYDAGDADVVLQFMLFGEVVYG